MRYGVPSTSAASTVLQQVFVVAHQPNAADVTSLLDADPTTVLDTTASPTDVEFDTGSSFESVNNNGGNGDKSDDLQPTPTPSPGFVSENELKPHHGLQQLEQRRKQQQHLNQREVVLTEDDYDDDTDPDSGTGNIYVVSCGFVRVTPICVCTCVEDLWREIISDSTMYHQPVRSLSSFSTWLHLYIESTSFLTPSVAVHCYTIWWNPLEICSSPNIPFSFTSFQTVSCFSVSLFSWMITRSHVMSQPLLTYCLESIWLESSKSLVRV